MVYNTGMKNVTFYTKLDCGLCDKAYSLLMQVAYDVPMEIDVVDITHDLDKFGLQYAFRIPVIAIPNADTELEWPFTIDDLESYLSQ